ncbi:hypothetical protein ILYODFUR_025253 [Ilyodon furcidens]|uniref:Uncharacterized protein n=1 Tax=Ilyodon furcidens TaxID=33524 RepID=A0ABV0SPH2_9TELE
MVAMTTITEVTHHQSDAMYSGGWSPVSPLVLASHSSFGDFSSFLMIAIVIKVSLRHTGTDFTRTPVHHIWTCTGKSCGLGSLLWIIGFPHHDVTCQVWR